MGDLVKLDVKADAQAIEAATAALDRLGIAGFASSLFGLGADAVEKWRSRNLVRWWDKLAEERAARKLAGKPDIPLQLLMPALRALSEEGDDDMLGLWAKLLAKYGQQGSSEGQGKVYVQVLAQMTPVDAKLLVFLFSEQAFDLSAVTLPGAPSTYLKTSVHVLQASTAIGCPPKDIALSADNLSRLACLLASAPNLVDMADGTTLISSAPEHHGMALLAGSTIYYPTVLARGLLDALGVGPETLNNPAPPTTPPGTP